MSALSAPVADVTAAPQEARASARESERASARPSKPSMPRLAPSHVPLILRRCACESAAEPGGEGAACSARLLPNGLQRSALGESEAAHRSGAWAMAGNPPSGDVGPIGKSALRPSIRPSSTLVVGRADDPLEREADLLAEQVLRMPEPAGMPIALSRSIPQEPALRRMCSGCDEESRSEAEETEQPLRRRPSDIGEPTPELAPPSVYRTLATGGQRLSPRLRDFFEPRFGLNLGHVRVHADAAADVSARAVGARAYTVGPAIVFAHGHYAPGSAEGDRLIAHELGHVLQSTRAGHTALRRQPQDQDAEPAPGADTAPEAPMSRADEIALSRSSSGEFTGGANPLTLSLYNFAIDSGTLKPEHQSVLSELGHLLSARATVPTMVRAVGFTDSTGRGEHNLVLSRQRALSVRAMLQSLVPQHITTSYLGDTNPVASNATVSGRSRNRRVDLRFATEPSAPQPPGPQPPGPRPPGPQPPGGGTDDGGDLCDTYPKLCGTGVLPFFLPLVCLIAPEACAAIGCALVPELCVPPTPPPGPPQPPKEPPDPHAPHVTFVPDVRADNTPAGMADRIGLRDPVQVMAIVATPTPLTTPITVDVDGVSARAGNATVNGGANVQIMGTTLLEIRGVAMTAPGFGFSPFLQLGAWWSGTLVGASNRFAVSSIIQDWTAALEVAETDRFGHAFSARMDWASDSGAYRDLDQCRYVELVAIAVPESGGMVGFGIGEVNDPDEIATGDLRPTFDEHGTPHEYTRSAGHSLLKQLFRIRDMRSGIGSWVASRNSGFEIERDVRRDVDDPRCWQLTVTKRGADVSIAGLSSHAGRGRISHRFSRLNCETPPIPTPPAPAPVPTPAPGPAPTPQQIPPCDREELARRVDACIEQAKMGAIVCTLAAFPPTIEREIEYLNCLEELRRQLLECDRQAKEDTHCQDGQDDGPRIAAAAGLPPPGAEPREETG